ncbi:uncharacterized protein B0I36DRAFT_299457 [Microdochium trichocladiopsis]|uniref:ThiJ/PfpI family protein n=1 Tax=Microdochium trichocladiopsis TaxID=1682393 RepID=A0A9P8XTY6_9PEZI|nr:uncharacterized protein B0I36DRAFT_299457 [Microdochium trichocladiopsis]KAH7014526.1 hypothetical protein B0I36DRAFT_299457 [Microdochium trichocladiopsis]
MTSPTDTLPPPAKTLHVGVFIPADAQVLDLSCVDIIGTMSAEYMSQVASVVPPSVRDLAPAIKFYYIGSVPVEQPIGLTSGMSITCTHHYTDPAVAAGQLDIVLVPGPDPLATDYQMDGGAAAKWLAGQGACERTDVLCVCTGIMWCGAAGLLRGKVACGPRGLRKFIMEQEGGTGFGVKELIGEKVRWWQDGRFWSSGGITNGNDLVAAYCRQSPHFPNPLVEIVCEMCDVGDRAQHYDKSQSRFIFTMVYNTFRAWLLGFGRSKKA